MRLLRFLTILLFAASLVLGVGTKLSARKTVDNDAPEITCEQDTLEVPCSATTEDLLAGVTASDKEDGDLTDQIIVETGTNFIEPGRCRIYYAVFDSQGKVGTASRMVTYTDYTSPVIGLSEPLRYPTGSKIQILEKVTATDAIDGDISGQVEIEDSTVNSNISGVYNVTLSVANSHADTAELTLPVVVYEEDENGPIVTLDAPIIYQKAGVKFDEQAHLKSVTNASGKKAVPVYWEETKDHTVNISTSGSVHEETPGTYYVNYTVLDSKGRRGVAVLTVVVEEDSDEQ